MLQTRVNSGLDGVIVADTAMSEVDGEAGRLVVRGHAVEELVATRGFEGVAALLWDEDEKSVRVALAKARSRAFALSPAASSAPMLPRASDTSASAFCDLRSGAASAVQVRSRLAPVSNAVCPPTPPNSASSISSMTCGLRMAVISRGPKPLADKTTLVLYMREDHAGALLADPHDDLSRRKGFAGLSNAFGHRLGRVEQQVGEHLVQAQLVARHLAHGVLARGLQAPPVIGGDHAGVGDGLQAQAHQVDRLAVEGATGVEAGQQ